MVAEDKSGEDREAGLDSESTRPAVSKSPRPTRKVTAKKSVSKAAAATMPEDPEKLLAYAVHLHGAGRLEEAERLYRHILEREPATAAAWINLGVLLRRQGRLEPAVTCLRRGLSLKPEDGPAWSNLGNALRAVNRLDEAMAAQRKAIELTPGAAQIHYNTALVLRDKGELDLAHHAFRRAELLGYQKPELFWDRALTTLLQGDLRTGFDQYESRWNLPDNAPHHTGLPRWEGESLDGKSLLVWAEQGLGDSIQFSRFLPMVRDRAKQRRETVKIAFEIQPPLARLMQRSPDFRGINVLPRGASVPKSDVQIPLLSLPRIFQTDLETIPDRCPYLTPPANAKPPDLPKGPMQIGIAWAGKSSHKNDRNRSVTLSRFDSLFDLPDAVFHSLQKGPAIQDIQREGLSTLVHDMGSEFKDFADTAAALRAMDLVITVDTSVAHLAGALARPVWVLVPYAPDWRWMRHRDDTPWYPSMTLFRQTSPGDWDEVFSRIRAALVRRLLARRRKSTKRHEVEE